MGTGSGRLRTVPVPISRFPLRRKTGTGTSKTRSQSPFSGSAPLPGQTLSGVPERVVGFRGFELACSVKERSWVIPMRRERGASPFRTALQPIIVRIAGDEVHGELAPDDELFEVGVDASPRCIALEHG